MYVCTSLDGNTCVQWVEYVGLLPALSLQDASAIGVAILGLWAIGWAVRVLVTVIQNR